MPEVVELVCGIVVIRADVIYSELQCILSIWLRPLSPLLRGWTQYIYIEGGGSMGWPALRVAILAPGHSSTLPSMEWVRITQVIYIYLKP
jgi:hypothetical protein